MNFVTLDRALGQDNSLSFGQRAPLGSSMPEGPSLVIVAEEARPLIGKKVLAVDGNSKQPIDRLQGKKILDIFSYGKTLNLQFDKFAVRIHFMLWGKWSIGEP